MRLPLLTELVYTELETRLKCGEPARVEEYLQRYPSLKNDRPTVLALITTEFQYRKRREPALDEQEYLQRFRGYRAELLSRLVSTVAGAEQHTSSESDRPELTKGSTNAIPYPQVPGFEVIGELGRGGMGVVYKAAQTKLKRLVALKMIRGEALADLRGLERFWVEAEAVARLQHPNIVQIFEVGEYRRLPYLALELVDGGALDRKIKGRPMPPWEAAKILLTLARTMHYAHQAGIVHRDLKPANILITSDGAPKITDFGLAKRLDESGQTSTGAVLGTPAYMAPEQASGESKRVTPAADVYALGAILYEMLTGKPPFQGRTQVETIDLVRFEPTTPPSRHNKEIPPDLEIICMKCLEKDLRRRYADAAELAEDLRLFCAGEPIPMRVLSTSSKWVQTWTDRTVDSSAMKEKAEKPGRRWSLLLGGIGSTVLFLTLVGLLILVVMSNPKSWSWLTPAKDPAGRSGR
jgi:serine/threonine protein kinase